MDRAHDEPGHQATVDTWLERSVDHSSVEIVRLFHGAFDAVWNRAVTTLGSVTLTAIAERVLHKTIKQYAFLSAINPRPNGDSRWKEHLHERLVSVPRAELIEGLRCGLIELLTVIGSLTAEILSPELHAVLTEVPADRSDPGSHALPYVVGGKVLQ